MKIEVPIVSAFVDGNSGGNPAGVVLNAERFEPEQKQRIAAAVGLSETACVSPSKLADIKLEFFTPTQQIAHCGHATVATFSYLRQKGLLNSDDSSKETIDGCRAIKMEGQLAFMEQTAPRYEDLTSDQQRLTLRALGITSADLTGGSRPTLVNTGNSFVVVGIQAADVIQAVKPDLALMQKLSDELDLIGVYAFCFEGIQNGRDAGARMFAPTERSKACLSGAGGLSETS
ncbi:PhzF family phenazine biosynthesis protein [Marinobacter confluentis]|uniref:PhzF family phenazine biosynthesis protein n=1 Tax=Marinobacter confluentis TaxID=1697557 RepID=A0A4Z1CC12_9GAMM|nr:PhzF family phenazine biosynthesis isomerase [Marinobacter confluentis]TGN41696.1 PhzF family phenazine biosynthesis protein [Marinobacter confluentis]